MGAPFQIMPGYRRRAIAAEIDAHLARVDVLVARLDLTKEQRDEHIRRYAELLEARRPTPKPGQTVQVSGGRAKLRRLKAKERQ